MLHLKNRVSGHTLPAALSLLLACGVNLAAPRVQAQPTDAFESLAPDDAERAVRWLREAGAAERDGRWAEAIDRYDQVYGLLPLEEYRFRSAICLEHLGRLDEARGVYEELAASSRPSVADSARDRLAAVNALLALPASLRVVASPLNASVEVGGQVLQSSTDDGVLVELSPGEYVVRVTLDGYEAVEQPITLAPAESASISVTLRASPQPELVEPPAARRNLAGPIVLGSLAVATAGVGLGLGLLAKDRAEEERAYDLRAPGNSRAEADEIGNRAENLALGANISFGIAAALAVGALVWLFVGDSPDSGTAPNEGTPPVSLSAGGISVVF